MAQLAGAMEQARGGSAAQACLLGLVRQQRQHVHRLAGLCTQGQHMCQQRFML